MTVDEFKSLAETFTVRRAFYYEERDTGGGYNTEEIDTNVVLKSGKQVCEINNHTGARLYLVDAEKEILGMTVPGTNSHTDTPMTLLYLSCDRGDSWNKAGIAGSMPDPDNPSLWGKMIGWMFGRVGSGHEYEYVPCHVFEIREGAASTELALAKTSDVVRQIFEIREGAAPILVKTSDAVPLDVKITEGNKFSLTVELPDRLLWQDMDTFVRLTGRPLRDVGCVAYCGRIYYKNYFDEKAYRRYGNHALTFRLMFPGDYDVEITSRAWTAPPGPTARTVRGRVSVDEQLEYARVRAEEWLQ